MSNQRTFNSFSKFYPYYLEEHSDATCRRLHFVGSLLVLLVAVWAITSGKLAWLLTLLCELGWFYYFLFRYRLFYWFYFLGHLYLLNIINLDIFTLF